MNILYFCSPPLLDYSAEQINDLKQHVNLHVMVCVSLQTPNHTIFKLKDGFALDGIYTFDSIKDKIENIKLFEHYFAGCQSVHFVFFPPKIGMNIVRITRALFKQLKHIKPQIIHFDDMFGRMLAFALLLKNRKIVLNVHDPVAHSGEQNWGYVIMRKFLFSKIAAFATFSEYSRLLFEKVFHPTVPVADLRLVPYYSYGAIGTKKIPELDKLPNEKLLLFFGRLSPYKGIDELLSAFSKVIQKYPDIKLVIAGNGNYSYQLPDELVGSSSLITINRFIDDSEIKSLFEQADVLICPYRDATQSGVLMTAAAFKTPVIVSNVGALSEYIKDGGNGYVYDLKDETGLENCILQILSDSKPIDTLGLVPDNAAVSRNSKLLVDLYTQLLASN
ncbi:glycosyltransferase involved in cell wall biosynthesis [Flavobacterium sp. CG_23.5]|uniref:glycosyltransferase family 4 protein n=1 Tax=Flavobacterium sp. CG_23.5 TaxID=2760708 RepID=UPI001AE8C56E|nr:glycosyltransferase family 4 protein [Flavobacterium sp. CG_23.5]MBP2283101.1 glycosyltransferase involved in cell wall biosynthesis [Flavobacterium sp. CG_23.5]